jgi:acyl-coenzyme A synthetase/AMP-(fatty) acid ligase
LSEADGFSPATPTIDAIVSDICITSVTSGSTGKPKRLFHTHASIVAATTLAQQFYTENDVVLIYSTVNHLGVLTVQFLPVLLAGCYILMHEAYLHGEYLLTAMEDQRITKAIVFPHVVKPFYDSPRWQAIDMSHIDNIMTGGVKLIAEFVDALFKQGVNSISSIYGLSEALPPVFINTIDPLSRIGMSNRDFHLLGSLAGDWTYRIKDGHLLLHGASLAQGDNVEAAMFDEFFDTGDTVIEHDGQLEYIGRRRIVRRDDGTLITLEDIEWRLNRHPAIIDSIVHWDGILIAAIKYSSDQRLTLDEINQYLEVHYVPHIDRMIDVTHYPYKDDAIKAVIKLSKELVRTNDGAP